MNILIIFAVIVIIFGGFWIRYRNQQKQAQAARRESMEWARSQASPIRPNPGPPRIDAKSSNIVDITLPRMGEMNTATEAQRDSVADALGMAPPYGLSKEQATLVLDARDCAYLVIEDLYEADMDFRTDPTITMTIAFILSDEALYKRISKWGRDNWTGTADDDDGEKLRRTKTYKTILTHIKQEIARANS